MSPWTAWAVVSVAVAVSVGVARHATQSAYPLLALLLIPSLKTETKDDE